MGQRGPRKAKAGKRTSRKPTRAKRPSSTSRSRSLAQSRTQHTSSKPASRSPRPRPTPETLTPAQRRKVQSAAEFCAEAVVNGWQEAVAERASDYITESTWEHVFEDVRRRRCVFLAEIAATILGLKTKLHEGLGRLIAFVMGIFGAGEIERQFARELAERIPLPIDAKLIAVARGVQVTGVFVCMANDEDLLQCQCFIDLALNEAKTRVKRLLVAAMDDWIRLAEFPPKNWPPALEASE